MNKKVDKSPSREVNSGHTGHSPKTFSQALVQTIWQSQWRIVYLIIGVILIASFSIWKTIPTDAKQKMLAKLGLIGSQLSFSLSVMPREQRGGTDSSILQANPLRLEYVLSRKNDKIVIQPQMGYLAKFRSGGPVESLSYWHVPYDWQFPNLDLKIANNSNNRIYFSEAVIAVKTSHIDPRPVLHIKDSSNSQMYFIFINEGWGAATNCKLLYSYAQPNEPMSFNKPYVFSQDLQDIDDSIVVDLTGSLENAGVDVGFLKDRNKFVNDYYKGNKSLTHKAFGPFTMGKVRVLGELEYTERTTSGGENKASLKFSTIVSLTPPGVGAPRPPTFQYDAMLKVDDANYEVRVDINQDVAPGDTDRFNIRLAAPKSSIHDFSVRLIYNDKQTISCDEVELSMFVPKSSSRMIKKAKKTERN
jgi:hypothetical protein